MTNVYSYCVAGQASSTEWHHSWEDFPYSDHEGVEATFLLEERDTAISVPQRIYDGERVQLAARVGAHNLWNVVLINILQVFSRDLT